MRRWPGSAALHAGLLWRIEIGLAWAASILLGDIAEIGWLLTVIGILHFFRGSEITATASQFLRMPQQVQMGFGESLRRTWLGKLSVGRIPKSRKDVIYSAVRYRSIHGSLLHSSTYEDARVIEKTIAFAVQAFAAHLKPKPALDDQIVAAIN